MARIAEQKIREAIADGEFDNLPGKGKPLKLEDWSHIPEDLRLSYKVLKNAGAVPEEVQLRKEIVSLQQLIEFCHDDGQKGELRRRLTAKQLRFQMLMRDRGIAESPAYPEYRSRIDERLNG